MDTNKHELILKEETFEVVGCAIEVLNELGQMVNYLSELSHFLKFQKQSYWHQKSVY
jgi:hypothetical protein